MAEREYDVVLFGATGFTGRLVAERLVERAPEGTRIALAGRSLAKLGSVRDELGAAAAHWPLLLADSSNKSTMTTMARSTVAVATTVGPYAKYGLPLVEACAKAGTHYVDLSGEVLFMRASADAYDEIARGTGARIVHACGFDSIPSDLGVLLLHEVAGPLAETTLLVKDMRGSFSGGTLASGRVQAEAVAADPEARRIAADPYALSPDREAEPDLGEDADPGRDADLSSAVHHPELGWIGPFIMGPTNSRVVRRSNALMGFAYSREFRYQEAMWFGEGLSARAKATGMTAGLGALGAALSFGPARSEHGQGASQARRGTQRRGPRGRALPHGDPRVGHRRPALRGNRRRPGRSGLRGNVADAGGVRPARCIRGPGAARHGRGADPSHRLRNAAHRAPACSRDDVRSWARPRTGRGSDRG